MSVSHNRFQFLAGYPVELTAAGIDTVNEFFTVRSRGRSDRQTRKQVAHVALLSEAVLIYLFKFRGLELDERRTGGRALIGGRPDEPIALRSVVVRWDGSGRFFPDDRRLQIGELVLTVLL